MNESPCLSPFTSTFLVSFHINLQENRFANLLIFTVRFGATSDTDMTLSILTVSMLIFISIVALEIKIYILQGSIPRTPHFRIINAILRNVFYA